MSESNVSAATGANPASLAMEAMQEAAPLADGKPAEDDKRTLDNTSALNVPQQAAVDLAAGHKAAPLEIKPAAVQTAAAPIVEGVDHNAAALAETAIPPAALAGAADAGIIHATEPTSVSQPAEANAKTLKRVTQEINDLMAAHIRSIDSPLHEVVEKTIAHTAADLNLMIDKANIGVPTLAETQKLFPSLELGVENKIEGTQVAVPPASTGGGNPGVAANKAGEMVHATQSVLDQPIPVNPTLDATMQQIGVEANPAGAMVNAAAELEEPKKTYGHPPVPAPEATPLAPDSPAPGFAANLTPKTKTGHAAALGEATASYAEQAVQEKTAANQVQVRGA